jgi:hypothetical protein
MLQALVARVAHDVKNEMNAIGLNLEVLRLRTERGIGEVPALASFAMGAAEHHDALAVRLEALLTLARAPRTPADPVVELETLARLLDTRHVRVERTPDAAGEVAAVGAAVRSGLAAALCAALDARDRAAQEGEQGMVCAARATGDADATTIVVRVMNEEAADVPITLGALDDDLIHALREDGIVVDQESASWTLRFPRSTTSAEIRGD